ncbi:hypothetical protein Mterra_01890 [Calidithermus terrae]|uniref:VP17 central beta-barrel domain-containing protein n=1 Tax=Calidithermus terrae TaxID=1408545 RepID=A0A399EMP3_9DEIN|nr:hypothetical protein [Calidithermus terrae]RIH84710.1 hypothetical protein Mterra_01890 [Calidithermus terrae]
MNLFDRVKQIGGKAQRGLAIFRDVPAVAPAQPAQPAAPAPVAQRLEAWRPTRIDRKDFDPGQAFQAGEWFKLAEFEVPSETIWKILAGAPFFMYLRAFKARAGANAAEQARTITLPGLVQTPQAKPALGTEASKYHPEVTVWARVGGVWRRCRINSVTYAAGLEACEYVEPANATDVEVYYVHGDGELRVRAFRKLGNSDTSAVSLFNLGISALHTVDQRDGETSHKWPREVSLTDDFTLSLEVKSGLEHRFVAGRDDMVVSIPAYSAQVATLDPMRKAQLAEIDVRGGI